MSDIPSTGPDNSTVLQQNQTPSHYERALGKEYPIQSNKIKGVIIDVKDKNITIITNPEKYSQLQNTKQQTEALSEDFKQEFINKLKEKTDIQDIKEAIENGTINIFKIHGKEVFALSVGKNIDYLHNFDGTLLFSFKGKRDDKKISYPAFLGFSHGKFKEVDKGNGIYKIIVNGNELEPFSDKSIGEYYKWGKFMDKHIKTLQEVYDNWDNL